MVETMAKISVVIFNHEDTIVTLNYKVNGRNWMAFRSSFSFFNGPSIILYKTIDHERLLANQPSTFNLKNALKYVGEGIFLGRSKPPLKTLKNHCQLAYKICWSPYFVLFKSTEKTAAPILALRKLWLLVVPDGYWWSFIPEKRDEWVEN